MTIAPAIPLCVGKNSRGEPCKNRPIKGGTVCQSHGGGSPQVREKARMRLLTAKWNGELQARGWEPVVNPAAELADLAGETVAFKDLARERVNELSSWEFHGGGEQFDTLDVHATVRIYQWSLEQCEKILSRMASLGLSAEILHEALNREAERPTREQVDKLAAVLNRVLADPRVSISGDAQSVVVDAMKAEGLG